MRKIRFRGFCPDLDRWLYGDLLQYGSRLVDHYTKIVPVLAIVEEDGTAKEIDPKSLGQLTCQVDCNGKEIYEGDLLYCPTNGAWYVVRWTRVGFSVQDPKAPGPVVVNYDIQQILHDCRLINCGPEYRADGDKERRK